MAATSVERLCMHPLKETFLQSAKPGLKFTGKYKDSH